MKNLQFILVIALLFSTAVFSQSKIFWVLEASTFGKIQSANIDGTDVTDIITNLELPRALAIDPTVIPPKIYYSERGKSRIMKANLDGSNQEEVVTGAIGINDITFNFVNRVIYMIQDTFDDDRISKASMDGLYQTPNDIHTSNYAFIGFNGIGFDGLKIYWTESDNGGADRIRRMNFDGSTIETIIDMTNTRIMAPWDIDVVESKIYWTDRFDEKIMRANKDGSLIDSVFLEIKTTHFEIDNEQRYLYWTGYNKIGRANLNNSEKIDLITGLAYSLSGIALYQGPTEIVEIEIDQPKTFQLFQNYPNPFNPATKIKYQIPELRFVTLKVYDVLGSEIITLVNEEKAAARYEVEFNAFNLPSGIYFYRLQAGSFSQAKKLILIK